MTEIHKLECPQCRKVFNVEEVLDHSRVSWPEQRWLYFHCPACGRPSHVELSGSRVSIGTLDGAPGPCFIPHAVAGVRDLSFTASEQGIEIRYQGRGWFVKARQ